MAGPDPSRPQLRQRCALCQHWTTETALMFSHVRGPERVTLEITVCEPCGSRLEKHLKRAIPKRLFAFEEAEPDGRGTGEVE
jgi:hypothetical protein